MIIGLSGKAGSGKDTLARMLSETREHAVIRIAIADPMKAFIQQLYPGAFTDEDLWGPSEKREKMYEPLGKTLRQLLQELGDNGRQVDPNIWARPAVRKAQKLIMSGRLGLGLGYSRKKGVYYHGGTVPCDIVCITDCRFSNEIGRVKDIGGMVVRIKRESSGLKRERAEHITETVMDEVPDKKFHTVVRNEGAELEALRCAAEMILKTR